MEKYCPIIFLHDYQDDLVNAFISGAIDERAIADHLSQWDFGFENEHTVNDNPEHGSSDRVMRLVVHGSNYLLSWNAGLGYVGLERVITGE